MKKRSIYQTFGKRILDLSLSSIGLVFLWPFWLIVAFLIKKDSPGPMIFKQKRVGKNGQEFILYKFRTMTVGAEEKRKKYTYLNEANGPAFKIRDDPRYTRFGKKLARTGLDELPQLLNILKGEMSLVGPRPLPVEEEKKIKRWQKKRRKVRPGIISSWVANGAKHDNFDRWMKMDLEDLKKSSLAHDLYLITKTLKMLSWSWPPKPLDKKLIS